MSRLEALMWLELNFATDGIKFNQFVGMCVTTTTTPSLIGVWASPVSPFFYMQYTCSELIFNQLLATDAFRDSCVVHDLLEHI